MFIQDYMRMEEKYRSTNTKLLTWIILLEEGAAIWEGDEQDRTAREKHVHRDIFIFDSYIQIEKEFLYWHAF